MKYRSELDGLRAIAIVPVILFHAGFQVFRGGFVGVDVFFVISGYLIASLILAEKEVGTFTILGFYERRARRILPALFLVMFACLPFAWIWMLPSDIRSFSDSLASVCLFASNFFFWRHSGYFNGAAASTPLLHTWSLAVEEQYYLLFPLFLTLTWRLGKRWMVSILVFVAAISLATAQWGATRYPAPTFYLLPGRAWELLIGVFIAFYLGNESNAGCGGEKIRGVVGQLGSLIGLLLIVFAVCSFSRSTPFPSFYALIPTIGAALIILYASPQTVVGRVLSSKWFVGIGLISYSAYLWHQPLFAFARHRSTAEPGAALLLVLSAAALTLAYLSWKYVERPLRNRQWVGRRAIFTFSLVTSGIFLSTASIGHFTNGFFNYFDDSVKAIDLAKAEINKNEECWSRLKWSKSLDAACRLGDKGRADTFAVFGDSHAGALVQELDWQASTRHLAGLDYSFMSCPPLLRSGELRQDANQQVCAHIRSLFYSGLHDGTVPHTVILHARWSIIFEKERYDNGEGGVEAGEPTVLVSNLSEAKGYYEALREDLAASVNAILKSGRKVILVYPVPEMGWEVPNRLFKIYRDFHQLSALDGSINYSNFRDRTKRTYAALDALGEHPDLVRIEPAKMLCNTYVKGRCAAQLNGVPLYSDDDHLSNVGARLVVEEIMKHVAAP